jgi:hypothetical protein
LVRSSRIRCYFITNYHLLARRGPCLRAVVTQRFLAMPNHFGILLTVQPLDYRRCFHRFPNPKFHLGFIRENNVGEYYAVRVRTLMCHKYSVTLRRRHLRDARYIPVVAMMGAHVGSLFGLPVFFKHDFEDFCWWPHSKQCGHLNLTLPPSTALETAAVNLPSSPVPLSSANGPAIPGP